MGMRAVGRCDPWLEIEEERYVGKDHARMADGALGGEADSRLFSDGVITVAE